MYTRSSCSMCSNSARGKKTQLVTEMGCSFSWCCISLLHFYFFHMICTAMHPVCSSCHGQPNRKKKSHHQQQKTMNFLGHRQTARLVFHLFLATGFLVCFGLSKNCSVHIPITTLIFYRWFFLLKLGSSKLMPAPLISLHWEQLCNSRMSENFVFCLQPRAASPTLF